MIASTIESRMWVIVGVLALFNAFALWVGNKPWRWVYLIPFAVPAFCFAQFNPGVLPDLWQGAFMIFGLLGSGLGLLGITHLGRRQ